MTTDVKQQQIFAYQTKFSKRAKRISLTVKRNGTVLVLIPYRKTGVLQNLLIRKAEIFLKNKQEWITKQKKRFETELLGVHNPKTPRLLSVKHARQINTQHQFEVYLARRLAHFNTVYRFSFTSVRIKNMKTRWGSCSANGVLHFSTRLLNLTEREFDYVIVHELCHLKEFNHGPNFWKLVAQTIPEHKVLRKTMRWVE